VLVAVRRSWDLIVVAGMALLAQVILPMAVDATWLRAVIGLPLVLMLPGYAVVVALFPGFPREPEADPDSGHISWPEWWLMVLVASIVSAVILGFIINFLSVGLRTRPWTYALVCWTLLAVLVGLIRRQRHDGISGSLIFRVIGVRQAIPFTLAILITAGALTLGVVGAQRQPYPGFTQLWLLLNSAKGQGAFTVGVKNQEGVTRTYRVVLGSRHHRRIFYRSSPFVLANNQSWSRVIQVRVKYDRRVVARLYRLDRPTVVYRHVFVNLSPTLKRHAYGISAGGRGQVP